MKNGPVFSKEEMNPLQNIEQWDEDVLDRYPEPDKPAKTKEEFRNYDNPQRDTVREFYRLNHKYQTYEFVQEKRNEFLQFNRKEMPVWGRLFSSISSGHESEVVQRIANLNRYIESLQVK